MKIINSKNSDEIVNKEKEEYILRKEHYDELVNLWSYEMKIELAKKRIKEFLHYCSEKYKDVEKQEIIVSFSGGKDSTVLLDLVIKTFNELYTKNEIQNLCINVGYAYEITFPETIKFIKRIFDFYKQRYCFVNNLIFEKPKLTWNEILLTKGFPIFSKEISVLLNRIKKVKSHNGLTKWIFGIDTARFSLSKNRLFLLDDKMKHFPKIGFDKEYFLKTIDNDKWFFSEKCCDNIKGNLKHLKAPSFIGTTTKESNLRKISWLKYGCNILNKGIERSRPISLFTEYDIWKYIIKNKLDFNEKYGLNDNQKECLNELFNDQKRDEISFNKIIEKIPYKRLGCISCPYGSHLEKNSLNRFETLLLQNDGLFKAQVIDTGMYKVLMDMGIEINIPIDYDEIYDIEKYKYHMQKYMELYKLRRNQIDEWYKNFDFNLARIIVQIENYKNYKGYKQRNNRPPCFWIYDDELLKQIHTNYNVELEQEQFIKLIKKLREEILENKNV